MNSLCHFEKYLLYKKRLALCELELNQSVHYKNQIKSEIASILRRMSEIKEVIDNYQPDNLKPYTSEKLFLRCRYINGFTMEQTAEHMNVSRNTVYRLKKKIERQLSS